MRSFAPEETAETINDAFFDIPDPDPSVPKPTRPDSPALSAKVLKAQAGERRENLLTLLDRIAAGGQPSRQESLDALLAVIEDAHSADPVLFGPDAASHFVKLHEARGGLLV